MLAPASDHARAEVAEHTWELRDVEFEDGARVCRFECVRCGAVRYE